MVVAVSTGSHHTCAVQADSRLLHCWGRQVSGKPLDLGTVATVAVGRSHTCAVQANSSLLRCWGSSGPEVLGQPPDLGAVAAIAAGGWHTCAIEASKSLLHCWGSDDSGQVSGQPPDLSAVAKEADCAEFLLEVELSAHYLVLRAAHQPGVNAVHAWPLWVLSLPCAGTRSRPSSA